MCSEGDIVTWLGQLRDEPGGVLQLLAALLLGRTTAVNCAEVPAGNSQPCCLLHQVRHTVGLYCLLLTLWTSFVAAPACFTQRGVQLMQLFMIVAAEQQHCSCSTAAVLLCALLEVLAVSISFISEPYMMLQHFQVGLLQEQWPSGDALWHLSCSQRDAALQPLCLLKS